MVARARATRRATFTGQRADAGSAATAVAALALAGAAALLLARLAPDVDGKPLFEDEAVSGLISARPVGEIVVTTLWDRGGAPLHFLLTHVVFAFDTSAEAMRWLSVACALAAVAATFDLGRRLAGPTAGAAAAVVAAGSGLLAVYGSFGRMYALLAFAAALAASLFVRAVEERTGRAALVAALAAWLLPAVHPYGGLVVALEALAALALWRGRPLRPALPVAAVGLAMLPFLVGDLRLAGRFEVSEGAEGRLATGEEAWNQLEGAVRGFAGGEGVLLVLFAALAGAGALLTLRRHPALVAWALLAFAAPPLLAALVPTGRAPDLSPRHLIYALPFFAAFVGVAVARLPLAPLALVPLAVLVTLGGQGVSDPRSITYTAALGARTAVAGPAGWLREDVRPGDVLYPYSSVFLAALPEAGEAHALPRAQEQSLHAAVRRLDYPVRSVYVAVPSGATEFEPVELPDGEARSFRSWLLLRLDGPFRDEAAVLGAAERGLRAAEPAEPGAVPEALAGWFELNRAVLCETLSTLDSECVTE